LRPQTIVRAPDTAKKAAANTVPVNLPTWIGAR